jgi:hypothetical protein
MVDLGEGAPAMMYRREAPKPVREPGFILPLIGCGCMYRGPFYQFGTQCAPNLCGKDYRPKPFFFFFFFLGTNAAVCS